MSGEEFASGMSCYSAGELSFNKGKFKSFERKEIIHDLKSILITERVYVPYCKENPEASDVKGDQWEEVNYPIKNVKCKVYGLDINWNLSE